jgi:predicted nuclease of restriction endonuclease-like RecB superfamily
VPEFIDPEAPELLQLAESLLEVFRSAEGQSRSQLLKETKWLIDGTPCDAVIARGLEKLLLDRVQFQTEADEDLQAWRHALFLKSSRLLSTRAYASLQAYHSVVEEEENTTLPTLCDKIFSDLPENQPVERFRSLSAERLLHRYNAALVQWLLLHSSALQITTPDQNTKAWRQFFRHLRFHQLLAEFQKASSGKLTIHVDGPLNLFQQTKKYGMALATFFPAVLHLHEWALKAEIALPRRKPKRLVLDHSSGLRPYSGHFLAHVPEEIALFQKLFGNHVPEWTIAPANELLQLPGDTYGFPDFTLKPSQGPTVALELFHQWHVGPLQHRLKQLESCEGVPLLLGVERKLTKHPEIAPLLESSSYFEQWGFFFRNMPSPETLKKKLDAWQALATKPA